MKINDYREAYEVLKSHRNLEEASLASGIPKTTLYERSKKYEAYLSSNDEKTYEVQEHVPDDIPITEVVEHLHKRFQQKKKSKESKKWIKIKMKSNKPIGLLWLGDPHIDDKYCDWDSLRRDLDVIQSSENIYGCSLGDYQNNWIGRLSRLYGEQETSHKTAWRLVEWLIEEMNPMILIGGNHDMWSGAGDPLKWMTKPHTILEDWEARIQLDFPNGTNCRIHAAHDMPGHSQFNPLHAQGKMAQKLSTADLYISGHRHNWALSHMELVEQEKTCWLARARGYKYHDTFAHVKGFEQQKFGQSIMQIIDPQRSLNQTAHVQCYSDSVEGSRYLEYLSSLQP